MATGVRTSRRLKEYANVQWCGIFVDAGFFIAFAVKNAGGSVPLHGWPCLMHHNVGPGDPAGKPPLTACRRFFPYHNPERVAEFVQRYGWYIGILLLRRAVQTDIGDNLGFPHGFRTDC